MADQTRIVFPYRILGMHFWLKESNLCTLLRLRSFCKITMALLMQYISDCRSFWKLEILFWGFSFFGLLLMLAFGQLMISYALSSWLLDMGCHSTMAEWSQQFFTILALSMIWLLIDDARFNGDCFVQLWEPWCTSLEFYMMGSSTCWAIFSVFTVDVQLWEPWCTLLEFYMMGSLCCWANR